ncbi:unnamed protein product [Urochloa humidicola]
MNFIGLALGSLLLLSMASPAFSCNEQEKASLQFLTGLSQDNGLTASWRNDTDCCEWDGITCSRDGAVVGVSLASRGLGGCISPSLGDLTNLKSLLSYNSFTGSLPSELLASSSIIVLDVSFNHLRRVLQPQESNTSVPNYRPLQVLNISSNLFTGEFPSTVWETTSNLVVLNSRNNSFQGLMPSSFCISSLSFAVLDLSHNKFSGSIPAGLGKCFALRVLKAGHNSLSGSLTDELFSASSSDYLSFPSNSLHGVLDGARKTNLRKLSHLDLGGNMLIGKIPDSIGQLKKLKELRLYCNRMSGELPSALSIPQQLCSLTNLELLNLSNNYSEYLKGEIPLALKKLSFLAEFNVSNNDLEGFIPTGGQFDTFSISSFEGNPKLHASMVNQLYGSAEAYTVPILSREQTDRRLTFVIGFCAFFGVGILYDQLVLSKFYG